MTCVLQLPSFPPTSTLSSSTSRCASLHSQSTLADQTWEALERSVFLLPAFSSCVLVAGIHRRAGKGGLMFATFKLNDGSDVYYTYIPSSLIRDSGFETQALRSLCANPIMHVPSTQTSTAIFMLTSCYASLGSQILLPWRHVLLCQRVGISLHVHVYRCTSTWSSRALHRL